MAHFKRGKCRYKGKGRRTSEIHYRTRLGLKPVKIPPMMPAGMNFRSPEWKEYDRWRDSMWHIWWPDRYSMIHGTHPRWHDILFHNRPRRGRERDLLNKVIRDTIDADDTAWPLSTKPMVYYW